MKKKNQGEVLQSGVFLFVFVGFIMASLGKNKIKNHTSLHMFGQF